MRERIGKRYISVAFIFVGGPEVFIEEEVAKLVEYNLKVKIDISRKRELAARKTIKYQIKQVLRDKGKKIEELVNNTGISKLEEIFPNICAVLKEIEKTP